MTQKPTYAQLEERINEYHLLTDRMADIVWMTDLEMATTYVSPSIERTLGFSQEERKKLPPQDLMTAESLKRVSEIFLKELQKERSNDTDPNRSVMFDVEYFCKDGSTRWMENNVQGIRNGKGILTGFLGVSRDITKRKQAEAALQESEARYRLHFEHSSDVIYSLDREFRLLDVSPSVERMLGFKPDELIGRPFQEINVLAPEYLEPAFSDTIRVLGGERINSSVYQFIAKDGTRKWGEISGSPLIRDGKVTGVISVARDITKKITLEKRMKQSQKIEAIGTLAGGIAHDFNNILSSIIGYTELVLDDIQKDSLMEQNLLEVYTAGNRAKDLVKQILAFARQSEEEIKPIHVAPIAKEVLKLIRSSIPATIDIRQQIESDSLIMGNATQIHQVLMNLCTNAAQAMEDHGGILTLSLKDIVVDAIAYHQEEGLKPGAYMALTVSDTGTGMSPDVVDAIFEPYFTTKGPGDGSGMGLAMVHGIVDDYRGKITVDSRLGRGSLFSVFLPVTKKYTREPSPASEELPSGTERILLVDDEKIITEMVGQTLERLGYTVSTLNNSEGALELFRAEPERFDLVITDMTMPNMTGDRLASELMAIRPDLPMILCTGYSKKISDEKAAQLGIKAFLLKPVVKAKLSKTVRRVLDGAERRTK